ncbi:MAG: hypothetical protein H6834_14155 [Planctomycetes bacterium]|nr:hypothetical protein [Planctomycetota bacterium]
MIRTCWITRALFLVLVLAPWTRAQEFGLRAGESWWRNEGLFPCDQPRSSEESEFAIFRILDRETGLPIPGARCELYAEHRFPAPTQWEPLTVATADRDGFVRVPQHTEAQRRAWRHVKAPGYGTVTDMGGAPVSVVTLHRGVDLELELVDPLGRPVPGARVGLIKGCGHTPDLTFGVSDEHGRAWLRCLDPDGDEIGIPFEIWVQVEHWMTEASEYHELESPRISPQRIRLEPAWSAVGRLRDPHGEPLRNTIVGYTGVKRGPWTRTDDAGRFAVHGIPVRDEFFIVLDSDRRDDASGELFIEGEELAPGESNVRYLTMGCPPPGHRIDLMLPEGGEWPTVPVTVRLAWDAPVDPEEDSPPGVTLTAVESATGFTETVWVPSTEPATTLDLIPGEYTLLLHSETYEPLQRTFVVSADGSVELALRPIPLPRVEVRFTKEERDWLDHMGADEMVTLRHGVETWYVDDLVHEGRPVPVPSQGRVRFHVRARLGWEFGDALRTYEVELDRSATARGEPVLLHGFSSSPSPGSYVVFRTVDERGDPVSSDVVGLESIDFGALPPWLLAKLQDESNQFLVASPRAGDVVTLVVAPRYRVDRDRLAPVLERVLIPWKPGILNLGTIVLPERSRRTVRVLDADGREARDWSVSFPALESPYGPITSWFDEGLGWPGARVEVSYGRYDYDALGEPSPQRFVLEGEGPWTLRLAHEPLVGVRLPILGWYVQPAQLTVRVLDEMGEPRDDFVVYLDGEDLRWCDEDGVYRRLELKPGWHRAFVTVQGCGAWAFEFRMGTEAMREFVVRTK